MTTDEQLAAVAANRARIDAAFAVWLAGQPLTPMLTFVNGCDDYLDVMYMRQASGAFSSPTEVRFTVAPRASISLPASWEVTLTGRHPDGRITGGLAPQLGRVP